MSGFWLRYDMIPWITRAPAPCCLLGLRVPVVVREGFPAALLAGDGATAELESAVWKDGLLYGPLLTHHGT